MMTRRRFLSASLLAVVLLPGCAGLEAKPASGLAGTWEGRSSGAGGRVPVRLVIKEDGSYQGTFTTADEERGLHGVIMAFPSGALRWNGNLGDGSVTLLRRDGARVLRFQRDDGGAVMEISERAP